MEQVHHRAADKDADARAVGSPTATRRSVPARSARKGGETCREAMEQVRHRAADEAEVEWVDRVRAVPLDSVCVPSADTASHILPDSRAIRRSVPSVASV